MIEILNLHKNFWRKKESKKYRSILTYLLNKNQFQINIKSLQLKVDPA